MNNIFLPKESMLLANINNSFNGGICTSSGVLCTLQLAHLILLNFAIDFPPLLHITKKLIAAGKEVCSKFITSVAVSCYISGVACAVSIVATVTSQRYDEKVAICSVYVTIDTVILVILVTSAVVHHIHSRSRTSRVLYVLVAAWTAAAVVLQMVMQLSAKDTFKCVSTVFITTYDVKVHMPLTESSQKSAALVIFNSLVYLPPVFLIVVLGYRNNCEVLRTQGTFTTTEKRCSTCAQTLKWFDLWWWRSILCFLLGVVRPCWLLGNWWHSGTFRDFPPVLFIMLVFQPMCLAQTINYVGVFHMNKYRHPPVMHV